LEKLSDYEEDEDARYDQIQWEDFLTSLKRAKSYLSITPKVLEKKVNSEIQPRLNLDLTPAEMEVSSNEDKTNKNLLKESQSPEMVPKSRSAMQ